jgi:hypothetical protein
MMAVTRARRGTIAGGEPSRTRLRLPLRTSLELAAGWHCHRLTPASTEKLDGHVVAAIEVDRHVLRRGIGAHGLAIDAEQNIAGAQSVRPLRSFDHKNASFASLAEVRRELATDRDEPQT